MQGRKALAEGVDASRSVAVDKSLIKAHGSQWHTKDRKANRIPRGLRGVDRDSTWGFSKHHGWVVQGYSYEVVVPAGKGTVLPLPASADTASTSEHVSFGPKIGLLPKSARYVPADSGYDSEANHVFVRETCGIKTIIPTKHGRPSARPPTGHYRRLMTASFDKTRYGQRWHAETVFSMIKRNLGSALRSRSYWAQCREMMMLALVHNIMVLLCNIWSFSAEQDPSFFMLFQSSA